MKKYFLLLAMVCAMQMNGQVIKVVDTADSDEEIIKPNYPKAPIQVMDTPDGSRPRLSLNLEVGMQPLKSYNTRTINSADALLTLQYRFLGQLKIGVFGKMLMYYQNLDLANIDSKLIELNTIEYNTLGVNLGYQIDIKKVSISPRVDLGYSLFLAKAIDYAQDKKAFLDFRYLSLTPRLNVSYRFTEGFHLGVYGGYNTQLTALKGKEIKEFNPNAWNAGISATVLLRMKY